MGQFAVKLIIAVLATVSRGALGQHFLFDYSVLNSSFNQMNDEGEMGEECSRSLRVLDANLKNLTLWAMEMWESSAREESAVLHGTNYQFGNFDECIYPERFRSTTVNEMPRQYCLANIQIKSERISNSNKSIYDAQAHVLDIFAFKGDPVTINRAEIFWAFCVPKACSKAELQILINKNPFLNNVAKSFNVTYAATFNENSCKNNNANVPFTPGSIGFICVLSVLILLAIISTLCHLHLEYKNQNSQQVRECPDVIKCFSMIWHMQGLNRKAPNSNSLDITYGLRIIAIFFIVTGHRIGITLQGPLLNRSYVEGLEHNVWTSLLFYQNETFVDMFFVLSGVFSLYQLLKYTEKNRFNFIQIIVFRYVRLVPLYAFVIYFTATLLPQTGNGPLWKEIMETEGEYCRENWWLNLLMLNNYINVERMCMVHSWYIPCDFHFFLLALLMCAIMKNPSRVLYGIIFLGFVFMISVLTPVLVTYFMKLAPVLYFYNDFLTSPRTHDVFQNMYIKSHTRLSSYVLGLFTGYILYKYYKPEENKISVTKSVIGCTIAASVTLALSLTMMVFLDMESTYEPLQAAIFAGLFRPAKAVCSCLFILICVFGTVPFISSFLRWRPWVVLGKLTYGAYLVHMGMQLWFAANFRQPFYLKPYTVLQMWISDLVIAFILSLIGYLLVEAPGSMLLRIVFMPPKEKNIEEKEKSAYVNDAADLEMSNDNRIVEYYREK